MAALVERIRANAFPEPTTSWLECIDPSTPAKCAMSWAQESNKWTCDYVYKEEYNNTDLLDSGYAHGAFPIIELQISKAALRLGTWLNKLVLGDNEGDVQEFMVQKGSS
jgi:hypothetical protein